MKIPSEVMNAASGGFGAVCIAMLQDTIQTMIPWLVAMTAVILCDLAVGVRKSIKLGVHVSVTRAFRETMGKMVVYYGFVLMVATLDAASGHNLDIAMWGCLFVCGIEGLSIIGNLLKPQGVDLSLKAIVKILVKKIGGVEDMDAEELVNQEAVDAMRRREKEKWEQHHRRNH